MPRMQPSARPASLRSSFFFRIWPFRIHQTSKGRRLQVKWQLLIGWAAATSLIGWLGVASGAYLFIKYQVGFAQVQFAQVALLPLKLEDYKRSKGEFWVREGMAAAERNQWRDAFDLIRAGLPAVPENREARILVARIYLMAGRADQAGDVLIEGIAYSSDKLAYTREVLGFLFAVQADQAVLKLCSKLLPSHSSGDPVRDLLVGSKMIAHYNRDQFAEAKELINSEGVGNARQAQFVLARMDWDRGLESYALDALRGLVQQNPEDLEAYQTLVVYLRELNQYGEIRRLTLARQLKFPEQPQAYLDFIQACADQKDLVRQEQAETEFMIRFADQATVLLQLAEYAARNGRPAVASAVLDRCRALVKEEANAALHLVSAHIQNRDYTASLRAADIASEDAKRWNEVQKVYLQGLRMVALAGSGKVNESEAAQLPILESRYLTANIATALATRLGEVGRADAARKFLERAVAVDSLYQPAVVQLLRADLKTKELPELLPLIERFTTLRKPPVDLIHELRSKFESDRSLFLPDRAAWSARLVTRRAR